MLRQLRAQWAARSSAPWVPWALWLLFSALAIGLVVHAIARLASQHIEAEALRDSQAWAVQLSRSVQDIDLVFSGEVPPVPSQDQLAALRGMRNVLSFALYDPEGRPILHSDSLGRPLTDVRAPPHPPAAEAATLASLGRQPAVRLHRAAQGSQTPTLTSETYVAVRHGARTLGVARVDLTLAEHEAITLNSFQRAGFVAAAAMAVVLVVGAALNVQRLRRQRRSEARADFLARHDPLTGVLNRESFRLALEAACHEAGVVAANGAPAPQFALLLIDLRRFRAINENHGVAAGDHLLRDVALRMRGLVRRGDMLARVGGDQFGLLLHGVAAHADIAGQAERLLATIAEPRELPRSARPGTTVQLSACAGAALSATDGRTPEALLRAAEVALTRARGAGDGRWSCYDAALDHALRDRRELAQELRLALAQDSLRLHFQPVYDGNGTLVGYEALARWPHPERGLVPPQLFIGIAEECGLIVDIGRWVLRTACREAATWPGPLRVAVNLSPAQVREGPELVHTVRESLAAAGLPPPRLEVEITESLLMGHDDQVLATLHALSDMGVRIALDDFGTGFSSLAYLWRYPFGKVKIDRAFTQRLGHEAKVDLIVRSIVRLAHALGMRVNAEGVETEQQRAALLGHGCDELQGYLLGRPMPAEDLPHRKPVRAAPPVPAGAARTAKTAEVATVAEVAEASDAAEAATAA